uniref:Odorant receptor n=1 Tax=Campoletis chlorideae TaxID=219166 RepID=A0A346D3Z4_9HYME|nr:odorant receptor [Campoletis chlorideae]
MSSKNWTVNYDYSIRYTRWLLRILGIWYLVATKQIKIEKYLSKFILPLASVTMTTLTLPVCCYIILRPIDHLELIVLLGPVLSQSANILMHFAMVLRADTLKICIQHMELDWQRIETAIERDIMTRHVRFSHTLTIACITFIYTGGALFYSLIMPLMAPNTINEFNETIRPLPFPGNDIFFDVQTDFVYEIVFTINFIAAIFHYTVITAVCNIAIVLVSHACGQIQIVIWNLKNFVDQNTLQSDPTYVLKNRIGFIIERHIRLLKFSSNIEKALKEIFLLEVVSSTLIMCFIEYDILIALEKKVTDRLGMITYVLLFCSYTFNLFLYCLFGEVLKEQCQQIGKVAYSIDWYKLPSKTQIALIMVINMGDYPFKLTAGGIMELSISNFASITKTSVAYLNMMRTMG